MSTKNPEAVFLDRDGVLNRRPTLARYVRRWGEFEWLPGAREAVALLKRAGCRLFLITNQAGLASGQIAPQDLAEIHHRMQQDLRSAGGELDAIYVCPHSPDAGCKCRKPKPGMLLQAAREHVFDLKSAIFIGDDEKDVQAGQAAGCRTFRVDDDRTLMRIVSEQILVGPRASPLRRSSYGG